MKHPVRIRLESYQLDAEGHAERTEGCYEGIWYHQENSDYLIYQADGIQNTLRWNSQELHLTRRSSDLEGFQLFRVGATHHSELTLAGGALPLRTITKRLADTETPEGHELHLEYALYSGDSLLGHFSLILQVIRHPQESP